MFTAISRFADLQDGSHVYEIGDVYPRPGYTPTDERVEELLSGNNALHKPFIKKVEQEEPKKRSRRSKK